MARAAVLTTLVSLLSLVACQTEGDDEEPKEEVQEAEIVLFPLVGGLGTSLDVTLRSDRSQFVFGETDLFLGDGIIVESVTVQDGYTAVATLNIESSAAVGQREATVTIGSREKTLSDAFEVIAESFRIDPTNAKMGEIVDVALVGSSTAWEPGYTWAGFGQGIEVVNFQVLSESLSTATIAVRPDAAPGPRHITMQDGPEVVTLYDGFTVDRAVITAFFDPPSGYQGDTVEFTVTGLDTNFLSGTLLEFWDDGGNNPDIQVTEFSILDAENAYGRMRLSNAARVGLRDVYLKSGDDAILIPDGFEVLDGLPDLDNVFVGLGFDVNRQIDNNSGDLLEDVTALAYFLIPLDPPCGASPPPAQGPIPYDINGVFPVPPEPEPVDCPNPETVSAGDFVWFESDANIVTLHRDVIQSTGQIIYRGIDLTLDDYHFGQFYDLHTQGDPDGIPEVILEGVQPTVPADYYLLEPAMWGDLTVDRTEPFEYRWTPAQTYPDAIFSTSINGVLVANGEPGFAGSIPWDDGIHTYYPQELTALEGGPVSFSASSYIEGPRFGLPFSTIQYCQSDSVLSTAASLVLE